MIGLLTSNRSVIYWNYWSEQNTWFEGDGLASWDTILCVCIWGERVVPKSFTDSILVLINVHRIIKPYKIIFKKYCRFQERTTKTLFQKPPFQKYSDNLLRSIESYVINSYMIVWKNLNKLDLTSHKLKKMVLGMMSISVRQVFVSPFPKVLCLYVYLSVWRVFVSVTSVSLFFCQVFDCLASVVYSALQTKHLDQFQSNLIGGYMWPYLGTLHFSFVLKKKIYILYFCGKNTQIYNKTIQKWKIIPRYG